METPRHSRHRPTPRARIDDTLAHQSRLDFEAQAREADADARPKRRKRRAAKKPKRPLWVKIRRFGLLLLAIGLVELGAAALTSRHFAVKGVDLVGLDVTSPDELQPIAAQLIGQNWLRADLKRAAFEAAKIPSVREAKVVRVLNDWPPRLALRVTERTPFARIGGGETWWIVDDKGIPFRRADGRDNALPALTSSAVEAASIQSGIELTKEQWRPARMLVEALADDEAKGAKWSLRRAYLDSDGFAALRLKGGSNDELLIRLGDGEWPQKLARARQSLAYFAASGKRAQTLNLVSYTMPTWTPRTLPTPPAPAPNGAARQSNSLLNQRPIARM